MRTFLAYEIDDNFRLELEAFQSALKSIDPKLKWVAPENFHLTLSFLGNTPPHKIKILQKGFFEILKHSFSLNCGSIQVIPAKQPKVMWVAFSSVCNTPFKQHRAINNFLKLNGFEVEKRPLKLHLTLARIKFNINPLLVQTILSYTLKTKQINISKASFYKSELKPEGAVYSALQTYDLTKEQ